MKEVALNEIFDIKYGNQFDFNKMEIDNEGVNFVSRSRKNLGIITKVNIIEKVKPFEAGLITVTLGGTYLLSSFVQPEKFYTAQNIKVLIPKIVLSDIEKKFYCHIIEQNRFRYYSHGREANKTLDFLFVPSYDSIPKWVYDTKIQEISEKPLLNESFSLDTSKWKYFNLKKLFDIKGSKSITTTDIQEYGKGKFPYVVTSSENNGTEGFYDYYTEKGNVLTVDSATVGSCFYQPLDFSASDHVEKLIPKFNMNKYIAIFLITIINLEQIRYGYGRKFAQKRIEKTNIKLPANLDGNPDWQFMENYIKSLKYSGNL